MSNSTLKKIENLNDMLLCFLILLVSFKGNIIHTVIVIFLHNIYRKLTSIEIMLDGASLELSIKENIND